MENLFNFSFLQFLLPHCFDAWIALSCKNCPPALLGFHVAKKSVLLSLSHWSCSTACSSHSCWAFATHRESLTSVVTDWQLLEEHDTCCCHSIYIYPIGDPSESLVPFLRSLLVSKLLIPRHWAGLVFSTAWAYMYTCRDRSYSNIQRGNSGNRSEA